MLMWREKESRWLFKYACSFRDTVAAAAAGILDPSAKKQRQPRQPLPCGE